jgi:hypothetical protein
MRTQALAAALALGSCTLLAAASASAANYTLWVHGRDSSGIPAGFSYWVDHTGYNVTNCASYNVATSSSIGETDVCTSGAGYATPVAVDYDGTQHISTTNPTVTQAMNTYCSGSNTCYIECHSAGCAQVGYTVANTTAPSGGWHITWVRTAGSAAGGSELANSGSWLTGYAIDSDLHTGTMRGMYNHDLLGDRISGHVYNYLGGDWSSITNTFFPCHSSFWGVCYSWAANDSVEAFHSSGHFRSTSGSQSDPCTASGTGGNCWDYSVSNNSVRQTGFTDGNNGKYGHCLVSGFLGSCQEGVQGGIAELAAIDTRALGL